jgi:hypothetical protein
LRQNEQLAFFFAGAFRFPVVKSFPEGIRHPSALPISALGVAAAHGMVDGSAQFALDGSVFLVRQPTLAMQFSHLHQHLVAPFRRIITIAKPCSYPKNQPGGNG